MDIQSARPAPQFGGMRITKKPDTVKVQFFDDTHPFIKEDELVLVGLDPDRPSVSFHHALVRRLAQLALHDNNWSPANPRKPEQRVVFCRTVSPLVRLLGLPDADRRKLEETLLQPKRVTRDLLTSKTVYILDGQEVTSEDSFWKAGVERMPVNGKGFVFYIPDDLKALPSAKH